eukprot:9384906-Pyramimonas_sp.AAC.1
MLGSLAPSPAPSGPLRRLPRRLRGPARSGPGPGGPPGPARRGPVQCHRSLFSRALSAALWDRG